MVPTRIYIKTDPRRLAPAPSRFLTFVKDRVKPTVVATITIQKNPLVRLKFAV
jgi:hypothetical protein